MASYGLPAQAKANPRPDPLLFLGGPACRSPGIRSPRASQGHFNGFLWTSSAGKSYPKARSIAFSGRSSVPLARHSQPTGIPRPHPWLFMGVQACRLPALKRSKPLKPIKGHFNGFLWASSAGKSYPKARSIAVSGRSSVPFARHSQPTGIPRPLQWLLMGFQRKQKLPHGQIHCCFWAVQRAVGQAFAANRHPKATSMAFYGRPSLPFASPKTLQTPKTPKRPLASYGLPAQAKATPRPDPLLFLGGPACRSPGIRSQRASQGHINGFLWASSGGKSYPKARSIAFSGRSSVPLARHSQPTGIPRPHPWLFMGVQACRVPALKRSKPLKPLKGHFNGFLWASSAGKSYPKARSIAVSGRSSVPFARHSQPTGIPRPHPWLFMGVQACRLPALKRSRHSQPTGIPRPHQWFLMGFQRRQRLPQGQIHCCFWAVQRAVARHSQPTGIPRPHPWLFMGVQACRLPALKRSKRLKPVKGHFNGFLWASSARKSYPKTRSIAVSGRSSVPFARHSQPTGIPRPHQWLLVGFQRRQKLPQGQIHCCFWAVQRAVRQAFLWASSAGKSYPRPDPLLFVGDSACRSPGIRSQRASQGHFNGFLWTSSAGKSYPKARSIAFSGRSSVPLARHSQPTGIPRPHPWLFMGVQACRLPALKRSKRLKTPKTSKILKFSHPCARARNARR